MNWRKRMCLILKIFLLMLIYNMFFIDAYPVVSGERGLSVTLTCVFKNDETTPPTITWSKDPGLVVATSVSGISHTTGSLAGRASLSGGNLSINSLLISDAGLYTCNVIAVGSIQESTSIQLNVTAKPTITSFSIPSSNLDVDGMYSPALCRAKEGKPAARIEWTDLTGKIQLSRSTQTLQPDGTYDVESKLLLYPGLDGHTLNSSKPIKENKKFRCHVIHDDVTSLEAWRTVEIRLMYSPIVHISLLANNLTCHVSGNPLPLVTWYSPNGHVIRDRAFVMIGSQDNGKYTCSASSVLKPDALASIDIQKARDLPTLFRTLVQFNTSVPESALGYKIQCSAEVTGLPDGVKFVWLKDDTLIDKEVREYTVQSTRKKQGFIYRITSSLIFQNVTRGRDDAKFSCRMTNSSDLTGFVTAVEKSISLTVDYAPIMTYIQVNKNVSVPNGAWVVENDNLILKCEADMRPEGVFEWFYQGQKIATGKTLLLGSIQRNQAGAYTCLTHNYVPGSSSSDVIVTVQYPPSQAMVREVGEDGLQCFTESIPQPIYKWIYPNGSQTLGNNSMSQPKQTTGIFVCMVYNHLGSSNASYTQLSSSLSRIGSLSVTEFSLTVSICICVGFVLICIIFWMVFRRHSQRKSTDILGANNALKCYLEYPEPPVPIVNDTVMSSPTRKISQVKARHSGFKNKNTLDGKSKNIQEVQYVECKSPTSLNDKPITIFNSKSFASVKNQTGNNDSVKFANTEVDGSSIEIIENESVSMTEKSNTVLVSTRDEAHTLENSNVLCSPSRMQRIRREVALQMYGQGDTQTYHQSTLPKCYTKPPLPLHPVPWYPTVTNPMLYDDTWRPTGTRYMSDEECVLPYATLRMHSRKLSNQTSSVATGTRGDSSNCSEDFMYGVKRPRSMSLSATYSSSDSNITASSVTNIDPPNMIAAPKKTQISSRNHSPFDSGNDSVKSIRTTPNGKKQSHTLV